MSKLIGACCNRGQQKLGVSKGPPFIYKYIYDTNHMYKDTSSKLLQKHNNIYTNVPKPNMDSIRAFRMKDRDYMNTVDIYDYSGTGYRELYELHNYYLFQGKNVVTIGGDHSISISTAASSAQKYNDDLVLVWVDAHPDLHTRESSTSKNMHGMSAGSILGLDNIFDFPTIRPEQLIYIGLRDIDAHEQKIMQDYNIEYYDMDYIKRNGIKQILHNIRNIDAPIHLSFDVDSIDPIYLKSTGTPVADGLTISDAWDVFTILKHNIVSTDIVEFNPELSDHKTAHAEGILVSNFVKYLL